MPGQNLLQSLGAGPQKQTRFVPIQTSRFISGLYQNRSPLRGPLDSLYTDFYHMGTTDVLIDGLNSEVSARSTMIRRPGNPAFATGITAGAIDSFYGFHQSDGTIQVIADSLTDVENVIAGGAITSIFTKSSGAGQGYFQGIDKSLYISDGVDLVKYIPSIYNNPLTGLPIWNWGGAAPTTAPTFSITQTGSSGVAWVANTEWTTMGLLVDGFGNVQQLNSVNATGLNITQLGTSSSGNPGFNNATTPGDTVADNGITWTNFGPIVAWAPNKGFQNASTGGDNTNPCIIYDPVSQSCYIQANSNPGVRISGSVKPHFTGALGSKINDGQVVWFCLGAPKAPLLWQPAHAYPALGSVSNNDSVSSIVYPVTCAQAGIGSANAQTVYWFVSSGGTSGAGGTAPFASNETAGTITTDGDLLWTCLGTATRANNTNYVPWTSTGSTFSVIKDGASNLQVCVSATGPSGSSAPTFATSYGQTTQDGVNAGTNTFIGVTWVCVGTSLSWIASTQWYLPTSGFTPPTPAQPFGGATLVDTNGINQYVVNSGLSGSPTHPSWSGLGLTTTDNAVTWLAVSAFTAAGSSWIKNRGYVFSFKARRPSDVFVTTSPPLQIPNTNSPNITGPLGPPTGAQDGTVTTASPLIQITSGNTGAQVLLTGLGSTDPQFDTIEIFRSADGFSASGPYLFLTDIPMPPVVGNQPGTWQIIDFMPDLPTNLLPGLNPLIIAPINHENDPPPGQFGSTQFVQSSAATPTIPLAGSTLLGQVYHEGRLWGFLGNVVYASGGPDTVTGNGFTAWPPSNVFPFQSNVVKLLSTTAGLLVFTTTDLGFIGGGPAITDFTPQIIVPGLGLLAPNAVALLGGTPYLFTSDRQFLSVDTSSGITRIGHPIGNILADFDPTTAYVTYHTYGDLDHAFFVADGSGQWYRCDINPAPDGKYTGPVWSPKATVGSGFKAIASIETAPGTHQLLIGPTSAGHILARDSTFTTFADDGAPYHSFFVVGNVTLAHAGQMAQLHFLDIDLIQTGSQPTVSILFDEIAPTVDVPFEVISNKFITDPPKLYGPNDVPETIWMNRYYFGQTTSANPGKTPTPVWCKSLQLKVDFGSSDEVQNELMAFTLFAALWSE